MTQGIEIESQERQEICREIVEAMCAGYGTTLTAAIQKVNNPVPRASEREIYRWKVEDKDFAEAIKMARDFGVEKVLDLAENKAIRILHNHKLKAHDKMVRYVLDRKGGSRGYSPKIINLVGDHRPKIADNATPEELQEAMAALRAQS